MLDIIFTTCDSEFKSACQVEISSCLVTYPALVIIESHFTIHIFFNTSFWGFEKCLRRSSFIWVSLDWNLPSFELGKGPEEVMARPGLTEWNKIWKTSRIWNRTTQAFQEVWGQSHWLRATNLRFWYHFQAFAARGFDFQATLSSKYWQPIIVSWLNSPYPEEKLPVW